MRALVVFCVWLPVVSVSAQEYSRQDLIASTGWLASRLEDTTVRIVDTRRNGYEDEHIPGAVHMDIDWSRDRDSPPTYLPDLDQFAERLGALGIGADTHIVFYDDRGGIYGTRPWVILQILGHPKASIVNGGWKKWVHENRPVTAETTRVVPQEYVPAAGEMEVADWVVTSRDVLAAAEGGQSQIIDTRTAAEFVGSDLQNNPRGGAIPGATHIFWEEVLQGEFQTLRPASELEMLFGQAGVRKDQPIVTYCQGAGRAAHELFVLHLLGYEDIKLYMGSWEAWSRDPALPMR